MNDIDHDESQDWEEHVDAFAQQLRSLRPSPPTQPWSSIAESIEASLDQPEAVSKARPTTSTWRPVVSHSITAVIGALIGVALMLTLPQTDSISRSGSTVEFANRQNTGDKQPANLAHKETETLAKSNEDSSSTNQRSTPTWRSQRLTRTASHFGPLRAFGSISGSLQLMRAETELNSSQRSQRRSENDDDASSIQQIQDSPLDKPILSPRSWHLFLQELTHLPTSDVPFCKAKGCQS